MQWTGVCLVPETRSFLEQQENEVKVAQEQLLTFYLTDEVVPNPAQHPFFTGRGATAELAEQAAYTVYLRAQPCTHLFVPQDRGISACQRCGVLLRSLQQNSARKASEASGWRRLWTRFR